MLLRKWEKCGKNIHSGKDLPTKSLDPMGWSVLPFWGQLCTPSTCRKFLLQWHMWVCFSFLKWFPNWFGIEGRRKVIWACFCFCFVCFISLPALLQDTKFECLCPSILLRQLLQINSYVSITKCPLGHLSQLEVHHITRNGPHTLND